MSTNQPPKPLQHPQTASQPQNNLELTALITLNRVPMTDSTHELSGEQLMQPILLGELRGSSNDPQLDEGGNINQHPSPLDNNSSLMSQGENLSMLHSRLQVDMAQEINKYFEQCASNIREFDSYKDKFVLVANHKIKKLIKKGDVEVNDKSEELTFKEKDKARAKLIQAKRKQVQIEKYEIIRKLKTIQQQQIDLIHRSIKQGKHKSVQMKKISSEEQNQKIVELLKAQKEFQKSLQFKTEEYIKNSHMLKKMQQSQVKKAQQAENLKKKEEIVKKLKEMELKTEERKQNLKKSVLKVSHNYIHNNLQKKFQSLQKKSEQQTQSQLKQLSMKHKLNINEINQHDRKYSQLLQKRTQSLSRIKSENFPQTKRYHPTHFGKIIDEQLFQIKQRNFQKLKKVKENQFKFNIAKYQEKIDQEHKPKVDPSKFIVILPRAYSSVSLSKEERTQKGLEYLAKAKQMKRSTSQVVQPQKEVQNYGYKAYKDYLKEREPSNIDATENQFKQIMSSRDHKDYNSLVRAKFLAQGLQAKSKKSSDDKLYFSAKTKLSLLSQLY